MRRPDAFSSTQYEDMSCSKSPESGVESHLHHMIKILNSTQCGKKSQLKKSFGVPLKDLIHQQSDENCVPFVVTRLCSYLELHGLKCKGLFRLSGQIKSVESLKMEFETHGDANLEEIGDVIAAASLLKTFFRELPETIIPHNMASTFAETYNNNVNDRKECIRQLKQLIEQLPEENFTVLRYLVSFLTRVAANAEDNCMNSVSLGIVFGPNIFRVPGNIQGMQLTSVINQVMTAFIESYSALFESDNNDPTFVVVKEEKVLEKVTNSVPFQHVSMLENQSPSKETFSLNLPIISSPSDGNSNNGVIPAASSPLDSDSDISSSSTSTSTSPNVAVVSTEFVEMTISKSVSEHLFGNKDEAAVKKDRTDFAHPKPRHASHSDFQDKCLESESAAEDDRSEFSEMKRICDEDHQIPKVCIMDDTTSYAVSAIPDMKRHGWNRNLDDEYHESKRNLERSQLFQRMPSKVRRTRKNVRKSHSLGDLKDEIDRTDEDSLKENEHHDHPDSHHKHLHKMGHKKTYSFHRGHRDGCTSLSLDFDPDTDRPSHPFLELHPQAQAKDWNSEDLPTPSPEPHVTGHLRASWPLSRNDKISDEIMLSPRAAKLKNISSDSLDPDIPPSPPVEQEAFSKVVLKEDNVNMSMKQLNKKIYNLKKKIKQFEEEFEEAFGYRPSHADKMAQSNIKKYVLELAKTRKEVKHLRDEALKSGLAPFFSQSLESPDSCQSFHEEMSSSSLNHKHHSDAKSSLTNEGQQHHHMMEESLGELMHALSEKRRIFNRPIELKEMNQQQVLDEKVAIQRSLLHYESVYGRPTSRVDKDVMRPIYDRYRNVKRLLAKQNSITKDQGTELQPILEHETMEFFQSSPQHRSAQESNEVSQNSEDPSKPLPNNATDEMTNGTGMPNEDQMSSQTSYKLHELTWPELLTEQCEVRREKKHLRRTLHEFEDDFQKRTGRRAQREDRTPALESIYGKYKQAKAKLRLLEALLSKQYLITGTS